MDSVGISIFLQAHWFWVTLFCGIIILLGAIFNWRWMCEPTLKPYGHRYNHGGAAYYLFLFGCHFVGCEPVSGIKGFGQSVD